MKPADTTLPDILGKSNMNATKRSLPVLGRRNLFMIINSVVMGLIIISVVLPLLIIVFTAISSDADALEHQYILIPRSIDFTAFARVFTSVYIRSFINSIFVATTGTLFGLMLLLPAGFAMAHKSLIGRNFFISVVLGGLIFDGGIIPFYLVVRSLGLLNTWASIIIPIGVNHFVLILIKNYMQDIPESLEEAALIEGASYLRILTRIIIPISKPIIAACVLFYVVSFWNRYFEVVMFLTDTSMYTLQVYLRQLLFEQDAADVGVSGLYNNFKMAVMIMGMIPVALLYPFLQKHFVKGIMLGSVKG